MEMNGLRFFQFREGIDEPKPLLEHLEDLRRMGFGHGCGPFFFGLRHPCPSNRGNFSDPWGRDGWLFLFSKLIVSFPLLLTFLFEFVLPGLTARERRHLLPALAMYGLYEVSIAVARWTEQRERALEPPATVGKS